MVYFALAVMVETAAAEHNFSPEHTAPPEYFLPTTTVHEGTATHSMLVGTLRETHKTLQVRPGASITATVMNPQPSDYLHLVFVVPDDADRHAYDVEVMAAGQIIFKRSGFTRGFGRRSYFIPLAPLKELLRNLAAEKTKLQVTVTNRATELLYIESLNHLEDFGSYVAQDLPEDDFILSFLINDVTSGSMFSKVSQLNSAPGVRKAFCTEIYYVARKPEVLKQQIELIRRRCLEHELSFIPAVCSWWAGTPSVIRDRLDFQQICWSDTDYLDEGQALKDLLGVNWNIHYGLTVPNKWSNTPWQTMNSPDLNDLRHRSLGEAMNLLQAELSPLTAGVIAENEPAYWAFEGSDNEYPVRRRNPSADYNPHTVADAKKAGIVLRPENGLDLLERAWLLENVARYNERTISAGLESWTEAPFYSHALLDYSHFPFAGTGHARSYAEAAHVRNARLGIEMIWDTDMDALWRVREWGQWGCVNREENDRQALKFHVATLRACYIMGGDMLNSYNWHSVEGMPDVLGYFNQFLAEIAHGGRVTVAERMGGHQWVPLSTWSGAIKPDESFPWFNELELDICCSGSTKPLTVLAVRKGDIVAHAEVAAGDLPVTGPLRVQFGSLAMVAQRDPIELHLAAGPGWEVRSSDSGPDHKLLCNMKDERKRSLFLTQRNPGNVRIKKLQTDVLAAE